MKGPLGLSYQRNIRWGSLVEMETLAKSDVYQFSGVIERLDPTGFGLVRLSDSIHGKSLAFFTIDTQNLSKLNGQRKVGGRVAGYLRHSNRDVFPIVKFR